MKNVKIKNSESPYFQKKGLATKTADGKYLCVYFDGQPSFQIFNSDEVDTVGPATVYESTWLAYNLISGPSFPVHSLVNRVRSICERPALMDGTILRRLREVREDGRINYEVEDNQRSIYRKL